MPDWKKIKAEYIRGGTSYRKLASKYGVSFSSIRRKAEKEKWTDLRTQTELKTDTKIIDSVVKEESERAVSIISVADTLLQKIEDGIKTGIYIKDASSTRQIVSALKDLREIKGLKSELDMQEQMARIERLRKDAQSDDNSQDIKIVIESSNDNLCG